VFIPRAQHEALLAQITTLQKQLTGKQNQPFGGQPHQRSLSSTPRPEGLEESGLLASVNAAVQRTETATLERKNAKLEQENLALSRTVEEVQAQANAFQNEVVRLHSLPPSNPITSENPLVGTAAQDTWKKEKIRLQEEKIHLQEENGRLQAELTRLKAQLDESDKELAALHGIDTELTELKTDYNRLRDANEQVVNNYSALRAENDNTLKAQQGNVSRLTEINAQLSDSNRQQLSEIAELEKAKQELTDSLERSARENNELVNKYHAISDANSTLEKQGYRLEKEKVSLEIAKDGLLEGKTALETEIKALREKKGTQPSGNEKQLTNRIEQLLTMRDDLRDDLKRRDDELQARQDLLIDLRKQKRKLQDDQADLLQDSRRLQDYKHILLSENDTLRAKLERANRDLSDMTRKHESLSWKYDDVSAKFKRLQEDFQVAQARLKAAETSPPISSRPRSQADTPDIAMSSSSSHTVSPTTEQPKGGAKRKATGIIAIREQSEELNRSRRPVTPENKPEKRQKIDPPAVTPFRRKGAVYVVEMPVLVNVSALASALATLGTKVLELRRVFKTAPNGSERYVVKFTEAPREFKKHIQITNGVYATLVAGSGTTCVICCDERMLHHDIMNCKYLGAEGQEKPTLQQLEMDYKPPALGAAVDAMVRPPTLPSGEQRPQSSRSLFDRVTFPDGRRPDLPKRALFGKASPVQTTAQSPAEHVKMIEARVERLLKISQTEPRSIFCRFIGHFVPQPHQFLSIIVGGPVESLKIIENPTRFAHVDFVYPADARRFLGYAHGALSGKHYFVDPADAHRQCYVQFEWSEIGVKPLEPYIVEGIQNESWTRVLLLRGVPVELSALAIVDVCSAARKAPVCWIEESLERADFDDNTVRDVKLEFLSIKDAADAYMRFKDKGFKEKMEWGVEDCLQPIEMASGSGFKA